MTEIRRVLISGDRHWSRPSSVVREMKRLKAKYGDNLIVIGGGAPGADTMAEEACWQLNIHFAKVKALWNHRHASAGPQRNKAMLLLRPHELIAFHSNIAKSKGTKDMIKQAKSWGVPHKLVKR